MIGFRSCSQAITGARLPMHAEVGRPALAPVAYRSGYGPTSTATVTAESAAEGRPAIRVVLAEDNVLLREGLARLISGQPDLALVAAVSDLPELMAATEQHAPNVVVTDIRMPPSGTDE